MGDDLASSNVNRTYSLVAMSIAIFTFMLIFLYPRYASGEVDGRVFQATLIVMALATFSFVASAFHYYAASVGAHVADGERRRTARRADRLWMLGTALLLLAPGLVLAAVALVVPAIVWSVLWLGYAAFAARAFPRVQTPAEG